MKHTPTPWEALSGSIYQTDESGGRGVVHGSGIKGQTPEEKDANLHFIIHAANCHGELLNACKALFPLAARINLTTKVWNKELSQAHAAIAKAEGR